MAKYRKRAVKFEAWQFTKEFPPPDFVRLSPDVHFTNDGARLNTPHGVMRANLGDWLIKLDIHKWIDVVSDDIFQATYEPVEE